MEITKENFLFYKNLYTRSQKSGHILEGGRLVEEI